MYFESSNPATFFSIVQLPLSFEVLKFTITPIPRCNEKHLLKLLFFDQLRDRDKESVIN